MDYTEVTNPVYANATRTSIQCLVTFTGFPNPVPFIATADDPEAHGSEIYADLVSGKYGTIGPYVAPTLTVNQQYALALSNGLNVSSASDSTLNGNYPVSSTDQANVSSEAQYINIFQEFTTGGASITWADSQGTLHTFKTTATFMAFAKAVAQYVSGCKQTALLLQDGQVASFPANTVNIG